MQFDKNNATEAFTNLFQHKFLNFSRYFLINRYYKINVLSLNSVCVLAFSRSDHYNEQSSTEFHIKLKKLISCNEDNKISLIKLKTKFSLQFYETDILISGQFTIRCNLLFKIKDQHLQLSDNILMMDFLEGFLNWILEILC